MLITIPTNSEYLLVVCGVKTDESLDYVRKHSHEFIKKHYGEHVLGRSVCE